VADTQTDRWTDGWTDKHATTAYTALSIASRGKNLKTLALDIPVWDVYKARVFQILIIADIFWWEAKI